MRSSWKQRFSSADRVPRRASKEDHLKISHASRMGKITDVLKVSIFSSRWATDTYTSVASASIIDPAEVLQVNGNPQAFVFYSGAVTLRKTSEALENKKPRQR